MACGAGWRHHAVPMPGRFAKFCVGFVIFFLDLPRAVPHRPARIGGSE
jgi:hypothetical protein